MSNDKISSTWLQQQHSQMVFKSNSASHLPQQIQSMKLVLIFSEDAAKSGVLYNDVKISIFLGCLKNFLQLQETVTVIENYQQDNMLIIPFALKSDLKIVLAHPQEVFALVTFPSGKPTLLAGSYLMVSGAAVTTQEKTCECLSSSQKSN